MGAVFSLFCHSKTDNISFKLNLAFWTTLTSGLFAANLGTWDPPEHRQKFPSGSNSHLRQNIIIYLGSNSVVSLSTMLNAGSSVTSVARSLKISRQSVYRIRPEVEAAWCEQWVFLVCRNINEMSSFNALDRNSSLIKTEEECRATVPLELDQMTSLYSGWGHSNCLPLPEMGVSIRVGVSQLSFHHFHTYRSVVTNHLR